MDLYAELEAVVRALEAAGVEYALVGGLAVAVWGHARATKDIDLVVEESQWEAVRAAARTAGFTLEAMPVRFRDGMELRRLTKVAGGQHLTCDFILRNEDLEQLWSERVRVPTEWGTVSVASRSSLVAMKLASGRPIDIADVERLQELDR